MAERIARGAARGWPPGTGHENELCEPRGDLPDPLDVVAERGFGERWRFLLSGATSPSRARLAGYKLLRSIDFVEPLPRTPTGKVLKRELRERYRSPTGSSSPP
jgi:acyl-CoA synthetase (AMP-forming)/AMP-acid ligase II